MQFRFSLRLKKIELVSKIMLVRDWQIICFSFLLSFSDALSNTPNFIIKGIPEFKFFSCL